MLFLMSDLMALGNPLLSTIRSKGLMIHLRWQWGVDLNCQDLTRAIIDHIERPKFTDPDHAITHKSRSKYHLSAQAEPAVV